MRPESDFWCKDCGDREPEQFMVYDNLWLAAQLKPRDFICRPCFEKRIGRPLTMEDFTLVPLNFMCVEGFATEDNYRKLYAKDGVDYDKTKAEYLERCTRLGLEPKWITADGTALSGVLRKGPISAKAQSPASAGD